MIQLWYADYEEKTKQFLVKIDGVTRLDLKNQANILYQQI